MTVRELKFEKYKKIHELKRKLRETDYVAIKFATDEMSETEYIPVRDQRRAWRAEINALETEISVLMKG